jgi:hypothetical protein
MFARLLQSKLKVNLLMELEILSYLLILWFKMESSKLFPSEVGFLALKLLIILLVCFKILRMEDNN